MRLDSYEGATADLGGYRAIDPTDASASVLLDRISDAEDPMPPVDAEKPLTDGERELLARWVKQGGVYAKHWAFVPPEKKSLKGRDLEANNVIDAFVESKLEEKGMAFAEPAARDVLARRAALVLTGLPPEPEQLRRFIENENPDAAYEQLLDELFASPRFGEHQARFWLDAVRYGDTHGLHLDNRRGIFPYRDWVVRAFNQNLPLDEFVTWQLAGDLLESPTLDQQIATGFVRLNPSTGEGGAIEDEFQAKNNFDRVETFGTVMLGMSLVCARCHTHKYDPITQTEYYSLLAFFNNTAETALDGNSYTYGNTVRVPTDENAWNEWRHLQQRQDAALDVARRKFLTVQGDSAQIAQWSERTATFSEPMISLLHPANIDRTETLEWQTLPSFRESNKDKTALEKEEAVWLRWQFESGSQQRIWLSFAAKGMTQLRINEVDVSVQDRHQINGRYEWVPIEFAKGPQVIELKLSGQGAKVAPELSIQGPYQKLAANSNDLERAWQSLDATEQMLYLIDSMVVDREETLGLLLDLKRAEAAFTTTLVAKELPNPRQTRLLNRGEYDLPVGEPLQPGVFAVMGELPGDASQNRLGLAQWLTSREHPLLSRVMVNQIWQRAFGRGLVRTPEDFGLQGQQPTHPELLDWLSVDLQENGWDFKRMLRLMVSSQTFKQSSRWRDDLDDPENKLWARGPSYRLDAEVIRDVGLWASHLLDPRLGGEGVKLYQPPGMWEALAHPGSNTRNYIQDHGATLYRRSLYTYWKRTSPHPMMTLFDAPDRESSCVRRSRTSTSLQSLGLFNETQRIEMGRKFAERLLREADSTENRFTLMFTLLASRSPNEAERTACESLLEKMLIRYQNAEPDAVALLSTGEATRDESLSATELAAWTQVCVTVLASDVSIMLH